MTLTSTVPSFVRAYLGQATYQILKCIFHLTSLQYIATAVSLGAAIKGQPRLGDE